MTVQTALERLDQLYPNHFTRAEKLVWLNRLEARLTVDLLIPLGLAEEFVPHTEEQSELAAGEGFDGMYDHWLAAQLSFANRDMAGYHRAAELYNSWYARYVRHLTRHTPAAGGVSVLS